MNHVLDIGTGYRWKDRPSNWRMGHWSHHRALEEVQGVHLPQNASFPQHPRGPPRRGLSILKTLALFGKWQIRHFNVLTSSTVCFQCKLKVKCFCVQIRELPAKAEILAWSVKTGIEMFRYGDHFMGIQGHPEYTKDILLNLVDRLNRGNLIKVNYLYQTQMLYGVMLQLKVNSFLTMASCYLFGLRMTWPLWRRREWRRMN